nr:BRO-M [Trichoplusia ni single nucleopolyhedrovirus]
MFLSTIKFVNGQLEVFTVQDKDGENWMVANPFAEALNYSNVNRAIRIHVNEKNQREFENLQSDQIGLTDESSPLPRNVQAKTKFINQAGVFELIQASEMPAAKRFKTWNTNELLPTLCQEGQYSMAQDAPTEIAQGINAVHVATNEQNHPACIKLGSFQFGNDIFKLRYMLNNNIVQFVAKDIAEALKYQDTKKAVKDHVSSKYKSTIEAEQINIAKSTFKSNNFGGQFAPPTQISHVLRAVCFIYKDTRLSRIYKAAESVAKM